MQQGFGNRGRRVEKTSSGERASASESVLAAAGNQADTAFTSWGCGGSALSAMNITVENTHTHKSLVPTPAPL